MTKEVINAANISLDFYSIVVSFIIAFSIYFFKKRDSSAKWFAYTNLVAIIYGISDIIMWISEGTDAAWKIPALPISSFLFFFTGIFIFYFYIGYILNYYQLPKEISRKYKYFSLLLVIIYCGGLCLTPFFDIYYTIAPDNTYHRSSLFIITVLIEVVFYLEALFLIVKYHRNVQNFENIGFASFIFIPFITHIIQLANFGIALTSFGLSVSFLIIFINLTQKMEQDLEKTKLHYNDNKLKSIEQQYKTINHLTNLIENRDLESRRHITRLSKVVELITNQCLKDNIYPEILTQDYANCIIEAVPFHDIGKIFVPDNILKKPGKVTPQEYTEIQKHAKNGALIVDDILSISYDREYTKIASQLCKYHHEKWNGKGYPEHLKGEDIPLCARIMAIADVFDALVTYRCYKKTISYDEAFELLEKESGESFDPKLIQETLKIKEQIIEKNEKHSDNSIEGL